MPPCSTNEIDILYTLNRDSYLKHQTFVVVVRTKRHFFLHAKQKLWKNLKEFKQDKNNLKTPKKKK